MLKNAYLDAKIGFDTAENEPSEVYPTELGSPRSAAADAAEGAAAAEAAAGPARALAPRHQLGTHHPVLGSAAAWFHLPRIPSPKIRNKKRFDFRTQTTL